MKKLFCIVGLILVLLMIAMPALAMDDPVTVTDTAVVIDWGEILSGVIYWAVRATLLFVCGVIVFIILKFVIPLLPDWVQWLKDKRLLWLAKILVNAAEVTLGRFVGSEKWATVCEWFETRGITVTDEVKQMIYNAWQELNNKMIELGLKEAATDDSSSEATDDPFDNTDNPVAIE